MTDRRDKRGRRIGYNWWREMNVTQFRDADYAWHSLRESGLAIHSGSVAGAGYNNAYYQLSEEEFRELHPRPTLKELLIGNTGMRG